MGHGWSYGKIYERPVFAQWGYGGILKGHTPSAIPDTKRLHYATDFTGGSAGDLDAIAVGEVNHGDLAIVFKTDTFYIFVFDIYNQDDEQTTHFPRVVYPDSGDGRWIEYRTKKGVESDLTVNLYPEMSASDIQTKIDSIAKFIDYGYSVTFQFADGVYELDTALSFKGFYGGGTLNIYGNIGDGGSRHTTQLVFLDFSGNSTNGIQLIDTHVKRSIIRNLKARIDSDATAYTAVLIQRTSHVLVAYNYLLGTGVSYGHGLEEKSVSSSYVLYNVFSNTENGIASYYNSSIMSYGNGSESPNNSYGLVAKYGGILYKHSTQPTGDTANESIASGGSITSSFADGVYP